MVAALILLISCAHTSEVNEAADLANTGLLAAFDEIFHPEMCMSLFENIVEIQGKRDINNLVMSETTSDYKKNEISLEEHKAVFSTWTVLEKSMHTEVTSLYDRAYALGCF